MSNVQVQLRRGTTAQHAVYTGPQGEVTVDTDKNALVLHDGATAGGIQIGGDVVATGSTTARSLENRFADEVNVLDYGAYNDGTNATATRTAIQAAMDSGSAIIFFPQGEYIIDKPLRAKSGHAQNLTIRGQSRVSTKIKPASVDISDELGINSLFINQENDGKLSFENIRFISDIGAYTGNAIYCVEAGSNSQVIFSGRINNCWFSLANTNTGYLVGGVNNYTISNNVFEFAKNCFRLEGVGNGDISFLNNIVYSSYDNFINAGADTNTKNNITVSGLRFIGHNRGPLFNLKNCSRWTIDNVIIENGLAGSTDVGVADIENCTNLSLSNIVFERVLPDGVVTSADAFKIKTSTGIQISDTILNDLNNGFVLTGSNEITLNLDNVRLTDVATNWVLCDSNPSGHIKIRNCDFRNSGTNGISSTGSTPSFDLLIEDSFLINSGVSGGAGNRNLYMNTSGDVMVRGCHIGEQGGSALAGYFIENDGTGMMDIYDPVIVGTPPIAINAPGSSGEVRISGNVFGKYVIYRAFNAPTTGTWNAGDIVLDNVPTAGGTIGWVCVAAGTPGTWKTFGAITS